MPIQNPPVVAQWYKHLDKGQTFQVVSIDDDEETVGLQHFDGDLEEIDLDGWYELEIEAIEPPEDWTGPIDDIEHDDLGYTETDMSEDDWAQPLEEGGTAGEESEEEG